MENSYKIENDNLRKEKFRFEVFEKFRFSENMIYFEP